MESLWSGGGVRHFVLVGSTWIEKVTSTSAVAGQIFVAWLVVW